jgi:hypothetical protein
VYSEIADLLEDCAMDPSHQPAIYAAFIREIVRKTRESRQRSTFPSRAGSPSVAGLTGNGHGHGQGQNGMHGVVNEQVYDPQLLDQTWDTGAILAATHANSNGHGQGLNEHAQFSYIPQGGDMM